MKNGNISCRAHSGIFLLFSFDELLFNHSYYRRHGNTIIVSILLHCSFTPQVSLENSYTAYG